MVPASPFGSSFCDIRLLTYFAVAAVLAFFVLR